jgi:hypothetical protein
VSLIPLGIASTTASAESLKPWFHLSSIDRPGNLKPGVAQNEVQKVTVQASEGDFALARMTKAEIEHNEFLNAKGEPKYAPFPFDAEASVVQTGLEGEALYGAGNVVVSGGPLAVGAGDLSAATGTGTLAAHSKEVTELSPSAGTFEAGQEVSGTGLPAGTTITAIEPAGPGTVTLSAEATAAGTGVELHAGSKELTEVTTTSPEPFKVGQVITAKGVPTGTTITGVKPGIIPGTFTLTLSNAATEAGSGVAIAVLAPYIVTFKGALADLPVPFTTELSSFFLPPPGTVQSVELVQGRADGQIVLAAINVGDAPAHGESGNPVVITDKLPAGLRAVSVEAISGDSATSSDGPVDCAVQAAHEVQCTFGGTYEIENVNTHKIETLAKILPPFQQIEVMISVALEGAHTGELNEASVSGAGAPVTHATPHPIAVSGELTPFGVENYEQSEEEPAGAPDTQAGSHPFQQTTTFDFNQTLNAAGEAVPVALGKDLHFKLPAGLIGNPTAYPRCTLSQFATLVGKVNECPADSVVGVAVVTFHESAGTGLTTAATPLFNLEPQAGEPARFGFQPASLPVFLDVAVRTGEDYGVTVNVSNILQTVGFTNNSVTFWGVPGDSRHDGQRDACLEIGGSCPVGEIHPPPFLSLPTSCSGTPLETSVQADSWAEPGNLVPQLPAPSGHDPSAPMRTLDGCSLLPFGAQIKVSPDVTEASKPSGLKVDIHVPQSEALNDEGLAPAELRNITVALPSGVHLNPSASDGLEACSQGLVGFTGMNGEINPGSETATFTPFIPEDIYTKDAVSGGSLPAGEATLSPGVNFCANASKIGEVTIHSPDLPAGQPVTGFVYLAAQEANPFGSLMAIYILAEDPVSGTVVKLPGEVTLCKGAGEVIDGFTCEELGQIVTKFANNPQLPFEDAEIHFFGGERAPLATPTRCGSYTTNAFFEPWTNTASNHEDLHSESKFSITEGPNHSACPGPSLPFNPTLTGGATNVNAGAFSPFTATMTRLSGEQNLQSLEVKLPEGLSGILTGVELCPEPQANLGECGPNSLIGETTVAVGVGGEPYTVSGGKFYLTGPYEGAPFGITFEVPAKAGPFDLAKTQHNHPACDCVLVRGKIEINPLTTAITITSNPPGTPDSIPTSIEGIPLEIQHVNAITTRNDFQFNPTNCNKLEFGGTIHSSEGGTDTIAVPFQVTNCKNLEFTPKFSVSTNAKTSKAYGASLTATVSEPAGSLGTQSNLTKVKVELPRDLPSRLTTLQKACTAAQFNLNPANCPKESKIGYAVVHTPLVPVPLEGPAIFVSHGGESFPSLTMVLQGYGITIDLVGTTFISKSGVTSTTFKTVPDQPFSSFALTLPTGKFSALTALGNVCTESLKMPTEFIAQNGAAIHETTSIGVTGCKKLTAAQVRAQKLKAALKTCRKKHNKGKREACERTAHKRYGPLKKSKSSKKKGGK